MLFFTWAVLHGEAERAIETLVELGAAFDATEMAVAQIWNACNLGEAYCRTGRLKEAAETLDEAIEPAGRLGYRFYLGCALRLRAEVVRKADPTEPGRLRASEYFERAIGVLAEIGAENELALAHAGYARLCRESGDSDKARRYYLTAAGNARAARIARRAAGHSQGPHRALTQSPLRRSRTSRTILSPSPLYELEAQEARRACGRAVWRPDVDLHGLSWPVEGCESGRIGRSRKPLSLRVPWVQIPLPPLSADQVRSS